MISARTLVASLAALAVANAFAPINRPASTMQSTALEFGFLKDMGLEKPSWLPDFGSEKKDDSPAPAEETEGDAEDASEEAAETAE